MMTNVRKAQIVPPWGAMLAGVFVAFPSFMPGVGDGGWPRTTDLLNGLGIGIIFLALYRSAQLHPVIRGILLVWGLSVPWIFMEIYALSGVPDPPVQRLLIRWILCAGSAYLVAVIASSTVLRSRFLYGFLIGIVFSTITLVYDFLTFSPQDMPIEQLVNLAIYNGKDINDFIYRAGGIFGHPNGAAGCVLLGVPVLIGAIQEGKLPRWSVAIAIFLMAAVFYLTKSRGPLLVASALVAYWLWSQSRGVRVPLVLAAAVAVLVIVAAGGFAEGLGGGVLLERFLDVGGISVNASDRWWTISTSLDLMLRNPLGMGSAYVEPLETATGTSATHNAYLELALMGGVPLTIFVILRLVKSARCLFMPRQPVEAWVAAYLLGIFAFESYFLQLNIQVIALWLVISPVRSFSGLTLRGPAAVLPAFTQESFPALRTNRDPMR